MTTLKCEYCYDFFDTEDKLKRHNKNSKTCSKYKNILFTCLKCKFKTQGIKNIDKHIETCGNKTNEDDNMSYELLSDDEIILCKKSLESQILKKLDIIIKNTKPTKNTVKKQIIPPIFANYIDNEPEKITNNSINTKKQQNIQPLKDVGSLQFYIKDEDSKNIPFSCNSSVVSSFDNRSGMSPSLPKSKKQFYKKLRCIELVNELTPEEQNEKLKYLKEEYNKSQDSYNELVKTNEKMFKEIFEDLKQTTRITQKTLDNIKKKRLELLDCMSLQNYYQLLQKHLKSLENILKNKKEFTDKKIITTISKTMNNIDMRLVSYHNYVNYNLEIDEIQKFKSSLKFFNVSSEKFEIFDNETFFNKFYNYGASLFTIKDIFEMYIVNRYNFNNIIYVPIKQSTDTDPYSFYYLEDIILQKNNMFKRYWKMDCRLEELTNTFISNIRPFLIQLFRKLYYDVFNDNEYRKGYKTSNPITEYDCEQVLQNIYTLSKPKEFCISVRNIVKKNCTYYPTENDRFNLHGDDTVQKKRLLNNKENIDIVEIIQCLFDNISSEDAVDFYRGIN
jgi:hypothetical protein